jgi:putative transcriptional regulator
MKPLDPIEKLSPEEVHRISLSQAVFAYFLNVSKNSISQWDRGEKTPKGVSLKLLTLVKNKGLTAVA